MIRTQRLLLRRARMDDLDAMHRILGNGTAMRYWSTLPHTDIEQTRDWLAAMIDASSEESDDFIVELNGQVIGKAGCWRLPEVGYILHPDHWGKGYAAEALGAAISHVFANHPVTALVADVDPRNAASLRLLDRLGFRETHRAERTMQIGDEWCDSVYLSLSRAGKSTIRSG